MKYRDAGIIVENVLKLFKWVFFSFFLPRILSVHFFFPQMAISIKSALELRCFSFDWWKYVFVLPNFFLCVLFFVFAHSLSLALSISLMNMRWRLFYKAIKVHTVSVTIKVKMCLCVVYDVIGLIEKFMFDLIALNLINFNFRKIDARWKCNQFWMMKLNITARYKIDNNRWKKTPCISCCLSFEMRKERRTVKQTNSKSGM